ncbi:VOC family protein [Hyphomicrobium sp.]|uniref:bleomycin resistance protein n=1 Tax=Hyphomicrobium sp. TaxID=82 RepID=UPI000FA474C1|nr:VOC family protein [Hyphomicrobium sp.]RUO98619.1 MAG: VOC family protein [Hyphomicrobium sp.]
MMTLPDEFHRTGAKIAVPLAIPVLISTNISRAADTYGSKGFAVINAAHNYLILRRRAVELHVSSVTQIPEPHCVSAYVRVADVDEWHAAFRNGAAKRLSPVEDKPWGMREFHFVDEDGNLLNIGQMMPDHQAN